MQLFFHIRIYCYRDLARKAGIGTQLFLKGFPYRRAFALIRGFQ